MTQIPIAVLHELADGGHVARAYQYLFAARNGATLAVPMRLVWGPFDGVLDRLPVPWEEAWSLVNADQLHARTLTDRAVRSLGDRIARSNLSHDERLLRIFVTEIFPTDPVWSHRRMRLDGWGGRCRVFLGAQGTRMAFTHDFITDNEVPA
ncbi:hypothetical protein [Paraburkholderia adhaesiva]|uniref:hypothetical protein n=1 Tax=Paraburkholderia adhaesiva TaxID=2883244 RepID=UPI001F240462|nr:hypothetical protein [Paraburkholderia adhaesiva]